MRDPLSEVIALLQPRAVFAKRISGAGRWAIRYSEFGKPSFCVVVEGACRLAVDGEEPLEIRGGDFVLLPATPGFTIGSFAAARATKVDPKLDAMAAGEVRHGARDVPPDVVILGGYLEFDEPDAALLASLLPAIVHIRGVERLTTLVRLVGDESIERRSGRDLILARLVEVMLIEALRSMPADRAPSGLLRGLADRQLATSIRHMHAHLGRAWTVPQLAKTAGMSRSAYFDRFHRTVGMSPMAYLLAWRMAVARDLLRHDAPIADVADRIGYHSTSTFSTAFRRHVGTTPGRFARTC